MATCCLRSCRLALKWPNPLRSGAKITQLRQASSKALPEASAGEILAKPSWSVKSLLPDNAHTQPPTITREQLHHLLRLSALPQPSSQEKEESMLKTLESQIHFVKEIQRVDTKGVTPLRSIRDETEEGLEECTIREHDVRDTLDREQYVGRSRRIQRSKPERLAHPDEDAWDGDALKHANKTMGRYFVVQGGPSDSS